MSHVPFLAVRPEDNEVKQRSNRVNSMDSAPEPPLSPTAAREMVQSRVPSAIRFPAICILSLGLNTLLYSFAAGFTGSELATASRDATEIWQVAALLGWKVVQLGVAYGAGYDYQDIASLALLTNAPYYYLLYTLWALELSPVLVSLVIDITTLAIPFALFRPLHAHSATAPVKSANQAVARDWQIDLLTAALAAVVYAMTFYLTYLLSDFSVFLVTHFDYIPSFERLHNSTLMTLLQSYMFNGIAAMLFMFRPAMAAVGAPKMTKKLKTRKFKPETASLMETIAYNLGMSEAGPSHRAEVLGKRALVLVAGTLANTFVRVFGTVAGTDVVGSLGYGGLWAAANLLVAVAYGFLGQE